MDAAAIETIRRSPLTILKYLAPKSVLIKSANMMSGFIFKLLTAFLNAISFAFVIDKQSILSGGIFTTDQHKQFLITFLNIDFLFLSLSSILFKITIWMAASKLQEIFQIHLLQKLFQKICCQNYYYDYHPLQKLHSCLQSLFDLDKICFGRTANNFQYFFRRL